MRNGSIVLGSQGDALCYGILPFQGGGASKTNFETERIIKLQFCHGHVTGIDGGTGLVGGELESDDATYAFACGANAKCTTGGCDTDTAGAVDGACGPDVGFVEIRNINGVSAVGGIFGNRALPGGSIGYGRVAI